MFAVLVAESGPAFRAEAAMALTRAAPDEHTRQQMTVSIEDLRLGMTLLHEVTAHNGIMLLKAGSHLTGTQTLRLGAFATTIDAPDDYTVLA
jgi:hypothetical protein